MVFGIDITTGLIPISVVYLSFSIVYLLNIIGGILINCQMEKIEKFSPFQLLVSIEKVIFCALVMGGVVIATNLMSQGLFDIDDKIAEMVTSVLSLAVFALIFAKGFIQKTMALMDKVKYMLEISDTSPEIDIDSINKQSLEDLHFNPDFEPEAIAKAQENEESIG